MSLMDEYGTNGKHVVMNLVGEHVGISQWVVGANRCQNTIAYVDTPM